MAIINGATEISEQEIPDHFKTNHGGRSFFVKQNKTSALTPVHEDEVHQYQFIAINKLYKSIVHIDVDDEGDISAPLMPPAFDLETYDQHNIPLPNYAVVSSGNRFHAFWLLKDPLPPSASQKSIAFFYDVRSKLNLVLQGDTSCNLAGAVRNPFYAEAKMMMMSRSLYTLNDINIDTKTMRDPTNQASYGSEYMIGNRNSTLFKYGLRLHAQNEKNLSFETLVRGIMSFQRLFPDIPELPQPEVNAIAKSILHNSSRYRTRALRNYGKMKMEQINYDGLTKAERKALISKRQSEGAYFTHCEQKSKTIESMYIAFKHISESEEKPTQHKVAKLARLSIRTVATYWHDEIFKDFVH